MLVTGATGFVGRVLVPQLLAGGWAVRACGRNAEHRPADCDFVAADFTGEVDFDSLVRGAHAIVHLAARVHVMHEQASDPLLAFRKANVAPTAALAEAALRNGVRQFVFASTLKVHGEVTLSRPFSENDPLRGDDPYAISKIEAEHSLQECASHGDLGVTILRPPLIYGPGVGGNFARLLRLVQRGVPLPFAAMNNRRSMLYVENFCSAVLACLEVRAAQTRAFLISDGKDISTAELIRSMAAALRRPARLFAVPAGVLRLAGKMTGYAGEVRRLTDSLQVDSSRIRSQLHWAPPVSFERGMLATASAMAQANQEMRIK